jgi:hypothetical protein
VIAQEPKPVGDLAQSMKNIILNTDQTLSTLSIKDGAAQHDHAINVDGVLINFSVANIRQRNICQISRSERDTEVLIISYLDDGCTGVADVVSTWSNGAWTQWTDSTNAQRTEYEALMRVYAGNVQSVVQLIHSPFRNQLVSTYTKFTPPFRSFTYRQNAASLLSFEAQEFVTTIETDHGADTITIAFRLEGPQSDLILVSSNGIRPDWVVEYRFDADSGVFTAIRSGRRGSDIVIFSPWAAVSDTEQAEAGLALLVTAMSAAAVTLIQTVE